MKFSLRIFALIAAFALALVGVAPANAAPVVESKAAVGEYDRYIPGSETLGKLPDGQKYVYVMDDDGNLEFLGAHDQNNIGATPESITQNSAASATASPTALPNCFDTCLIQAVPYAPGSYAFSYEQLYTGTWKYIDRISTGSRYSANFNYSNGDLYGVGKNVYTYLVNPPAFKTVIALRNFR